MGIKEIDKGALSEMKDNPGIQILNVLPRKDHERLHIEGSVSMPLKELEEGGWEDLDKGKTYVTHCSSFSCSASVEAADLLRKKGFDVFVYRGGIKEWAESGLPTEGSMTYEEYENSPRI